MSYYYRNKYGQIELTLEGQYVLSYFGLTLEDIRQMTSEQLKQHCKKFSDALNDGKITKSTGGKRKTAWSADSSNEGWKRESHKNYTNIGNGNGGFGDSGSYSRYFDLDIWAQFLVIPKASASERNKGLSDLPAKKARGYGYAPDKESSPANGMFDDRNTMKQNYHPTVKPIKLMSYLITMGSRENDLILDPFCGSGTTCIAATILNRRYIGIELQKEYVDIANKRLEPYQKQTKLSSLF